MRTLSNVLLISGIIMSSVVQAQKISQIQTTSVRAPKDIKIDGKPTEWSKFEAYNNANEFFYTISNDGNNLYLAVQTTYHANVAKIASYGITLTIKGSDKANKAVPFTITYPYITLSPSVHKFLRTDKVFSDKDVSAINDSISRKIKEIPITGAKGINDKSISPYNDLGIITNGLVDLKKAYTCELAIPLKYIEQFMDAKGKFNYTLQVNGENTRGRDKNVVTGVFIGPPSAAPISNDDPNFWMSPTHFDGVYTLAK